VSGVLQGFVLRPLLFLLFITDISTHTSSHIHLFADDSILYREIHSAADQLKPQEDLGPNVSMWPNVI
jgi:hypothetical protein